MKQRKTETGLRIMTRGAVAEADAEYARTKLEAVARLTSRPVLDAHAELRQEANPALERPAIAKATLAVGGRSVRAHVAARGMREAIDLLEARLRDRLQTLAGRGRAHIRRGAVQSGEWGHAGLPSGRPEFHIRPVEEREVRRIKLLPPAALTPDEAALEMAALAYDFFLFRDATNGADSLLYHGGDGRLVLVAQVAGSPESMALADAVARLNAGDEQFVFFSESASGRGAVLYRRYDGHYGLLAASAAAGDQAGA